jgi:hypothetical protein
MREMNVHELWVGFHKERCSLTRKEGSDGQEYWVDREQATQAARVDPAIVIPPAPVGEVEERLRVQRHLERVEARGGKPG